MQSKPQSVRTQSQPMISPTTQNMITAMVPQNDENANQQSQQFASTQPHSSHLQTQQNPIHIFSNTNASVLKSNFHRHLQSIATMTNTNNMIQPQLSMNLQSNNTWINRASLSDYCYVNRLIKTGVDEFLITSSGSVSYCWKYHCRTNKLNKYIQCSVTGNTAYNTKNEIIYFYHYGSIHTLDLKSRKYDSVLGTPYGEYFLFINGYHYILLNHDRHFIGHIKNQKINIYSDKLAAKKGINILRYGKAIYIQSKNLILLIGGYDDISLKDNKEVWTYSLKTDEWKKI
eukprot:425655_1